MYTQLTAVVVDPTPANADEMGAFLSENGATVPASLRSVEALEGVLSASDPPRLALVTLDPNPAETLHKVGNLARRFPETSFFVLSEVMDPRLLMEAIRQGVKEFIPLPVDEEQFRQALNRIAGAAASATKARMVHIIPAAGGCGATTVACNVAVSLAKKGRTLLIDLDLVRGAVATSFDLRPRFTIADLMHSADKLDRTLVENAVVNHASGVAVLARPHMPEDALRVNPPSLNRLLNVVARIYDYVVVDSTMSVDPLYTACMKAADINVMVMELTVPTAQNVERFLHVLRRLGVAEERVRIVVNRSVKRADVEPSDVEKLLKTKLSWFIPNDFKNAATAINVGEPVVLRTPRSPLSGSLMGLAEALNGKTDQLTHQGR